MRGFRFTKYLAVRGGSKRFDELLKIFLQLLLHTSGNVQEALAWMNELDKIYRLTDDFFGMGDFIKELEKQGYIQKDPDNPALLRPTAKSEGTIRQNSLEEIFGRLKKTGRGFHNTVHSGPGDEQTADHRPFKFGDAPEQIAITDSLHNAQLNHGITDFILTEDDLEIIETEYKTQTSTVLMLDISHSMILYGEDRITPAKKVALALAELIRTRYPKDTLDIIVFGNDAWQVTLKDLPYLDVGPYHTNTVAGLELAMDILRRRRTNNKQIFMITDGKPTCLKEEGVYYQNPYGLDRKIVNKTLNKAAACRRLDIPITTFMLARDPYLQKFVREFTKINNGRAFYSSLKGLGEYVFEDFIKNRRKTVR
jgi:Ca-activated chloride channel homolog